MFFGGLRASGRDTSAPGTPSADGAGTEVTPSAPEVDSSAPVNEKSGTGRKLRFPRRRKKTRSPADDLAALRGHLGLNKRSRDAETTRQPAPITVHPTTRKSRAVVFGPDIDGPVDAGEIVWLWVPEHGPGNPPTERTVLVIARSINQDLLGLLISPDDAHDGDRDWFPIGSGQWQATGEPCWVRLDKVIQVPEDWVRRQGALLPERRFDRVARALRSRFGWT